MFACLAGCSSYEGERYGTYVDHSKTVDVKPHGIPYELSKPQFLLTITTTTPTTGSPTTNASISYTQVPDPTQTFSLRLRPGPVSAPNFKLVFNQGGTIQSTTSTVTEQVTPTITAIGSFVVSALSIATKVVAGGPDAQNPLSTELARVTAAPTKDMPTCTSNWDYPETASRKLIFGVSTNSPTVANGINARITALYPTDDGLQKGFLYLTDKEKTCLAEIKKPYDTVVSDFATKVGEIVDAYKMAHSADAPFAADIQKAASATGPSLTIAQVECPTAASCTATQKLVREGLITQINAAQNAVAAASTESAFLKTIIGLGPDEWRARYVNFADAEQARVSLLQLVGSSISAGDLKTIAAYRAYLNEHQADAIGAGKLYERAQALQGYLAVVRDKDVQGGKAPASAEYSQYRTELDQLNTQIAALKTSTLAVLQPKTAPDPTYTNTPVCWLPDPFYVADNKDAAGKPAPWVGISLASAAQIKDACNLQAGGAAFAQAPAYVVGLTKQ